MSIHAMAWAKAITHGPDGTMLTRTQKLALLVLADYHHGESGFATVGMARLAREALMSERHARTVTQQLEAMGLLRIERRRLDAGHNAVNKYRLPALSPEGAMTTSAPATRPAEALRASDLAAALTGDGGILDGYLADFPDSPATAYGAALDAADLLAAENAGVSKDTRGYLRNAVLAHAATAYLELEGKALARLYREAKVLGADGHRWVIQALLHTASAAVEGDPVSYAIAAARRIKTEAVA